jgi:hypothetical protein
VAAEPAMKSRRRMRPLQGPRLAGDDSTFGTAGRAKRRLHNGLVDVMRPPIAFAGPLGRVTNRRDRATPIIQRIQVLEIRGGSAQLLAVTRLVYARGDTARDGDDDRTGDDGAR